MVLDHKLVAISKEQGNFGSMTNRIAIDLDSCPKIDHTILTNMIMPYSKYEDKILLINFLVGVTLMVQVGNEYINLV